MLSDTPQQAFEEFLARSGIVPQPYDTASPMAEWLVDKLPGGVTCYEYVRCGYTDEKVNIMFDKYGGFVDFRLDSIP